MKDDKVWERFETKWEALGSGSRIKMNNEGGRREGRMVKGGLCRIKVVLGRSWSRSGNHELDRGEGLG